MPLSAGDKLGPYEILAPLGAGGMGEVYKARDTRLDRTVAVKVLPEHIAQREHLRARFEREARAVASLNHPNICTLHDIGSGYMVMELIGGETLAARIAKGALPLDQALKLATQIADALDRAHRAGVTHRDVKPQNIMLTRDGVKVLDFGLAKSAASKPGPSESTLTNVLTTEGTVMGTPQYMAPEQFEGKEADARSDIFAFGCVLYEMVTGKRCFDGKTRASLVAAVLGADPQPMSALVPATPPALERLVKRCLAKDPEDRYQSMRDVVLDLRLIGQSPDQAAVIPPSVSGRRSWLCLAWVLVCLLTAATTYLLVRVSASAVRPLQFAISPPPANQFTELYSSAAISPDGRQIVFAAAQAGSGTQMLWLQPVGSLDARPLPGTTGGHLPFWSPGSNSIAFYAEGKLKRLDLTASAPTLLCDWAPAGFPTSGGTWSQDGEILFAGAHGLERVSAASGVPVQVTKIDAGDKESVHSAPQFLPDGKHFLYFIQSSDPSRLGIYAASLDRPGEKTPVLTTSHKAVYVAPHEGDPGRLLWLRGQTLVAQAFDARSLRLYGVPVPVAQGITTAPTGTLTGGAAFWASDADVMIYRKGESEPRSQLYWMDRSGKRLGAVGDTVTFHSMHFSPSRKNASVGLADPVSGNVDIWLYDLLRGVPTRFTFESSAEYDGVWSPDGKTMVFDSDRNGHHDLYRKAVDGSGAEELLLADDSEKWPKSWSPDGKHLLYHAYDPKYNYDLWILPEPLGPAGASKPFPFLHTEFAEWQGQFSPDGKWIAYASNQSGRMEIYVTPFPGPGPKKQISTAGGNVPIWRRDGKEIFYFSGSRFAARMTATEVSTRSGAPEVGATHELFGPMKLGGSGNAYDVSEDGQRFLVAIQEERENPAPLIVYANWQAEAKK